MKPSQEEEEKLKAYLADMAATRKPPRTRWLARDREGPYPYGRHFVIAVMLVATVTGGAYLSGLSYGSFGALAFSVVVSLAVALPLGKRTGTHLLDAFILSIVVGTIVGVGLPSVQQLEAAPRLLQTTPAELPNAPHARVFTFREGQQVPKFWGVASKVTTSKTSSGQSKRDTTVYMVTPLVGPGWTRDQPVPAWSVCESSDQSRYCLQHFKTEVRAGLAIDPNSSRYRDAIADAEKRYRLHSVAGARLVELVPDAEQEVQRQRRELVTWVQLVCGLWAAVFFGKWAWQLLGRHLRRVRAGK